MNSKKVVIRNHVLRETASHCMGVSAGYMVPRRSAKQYSTPHPHIRIYSNQGDRRDSGDSWISATRAIGRSGGLSGGVEYSGI